MRFVRILSRETVEPGARLLLEYDDDSCFLSDENVDPDQIDDPDARRADTVAVIHLTFDSLTWLHKSIGELLAKLGAIN